jgi:hypothetical protein
MSAHWRASLHVVHHFHFVAVKRLAATSNLFDTDLLLWWLWSPLFQFVSVENLRESTKQSAADFASLTEYLFRRTAKWIHAIAAVDHLRSVPVPFQAQQLYHPITTAPG